MARCLTSECIEQIPQKAEAGLEAQLDAVQLPAAIENVTPQPMHAPVHEMHAGIRFIAAVFRLKDDLRI